MKEDNEDLNTGGEDLPLSGSSCVCYRHGIENCRIGTGRRKMCLSFSYKMIIRDPLLAIMSLKKQKNIVSRASCTEGLYKLTTHLYISLPLIIKQLHMCIKLMIYQLWVYTASQPLDTPWGAETLWNCVVVVFFSCETAWYIYTIPCTNEELMTHAFQAACPYVSLWKDAIWGRTDIYTAGITDLSGHNIIYVNIHLDGIMDTLWKLNVTKRGSSERSMLWRRCPLLWKWAVVVLPENWEHKVKVNVNVVDCWRQHFSFFTMMTHLPICSTFLWKDWKCTIKRKTNRAAELTCDPVVGAVQVRTVVDVQVLDVGEDFIDHLDPDVSDDAGVFHNISQTELYQLWVTHLTCKRKPQLYLQTYSFTFLTRIHLPSYKNTVVWKPYACYLFPL